MIEHFRNLHAGFYPSDGCALLVRDAFQLLYQNNELPTHANKDVDLIYANELMNRYKKTFLQEVAQPEHGSMVVASKGTRWHCGVFTTEQDPGYVIHTINQLVKIEPLFKFKLRFERVEYYKYVPNS